MILAQREALMLAQSETQVGRLEIERLKLMLAKLRREQFGQSSERGKQLIEQLELAIEDLEESQAVEEVKVEAIAPEAAKEKRAHKPRGPANCRPICQWNEGSSHSLAPVANAEVQGFTSSARPSPKRLNVNHAAGRLSSMCGKNSPAGIVKRSASRRHLRMPFRAALPGPACLL